MMRRFWRTGAGRAPPRGQPMRSFVAECRRYVPELRLADVERSGHAGVRAQAIARDGSLVDDFVDLRDRARDPRPQRPLPRRDLLRWRSPS